jgi:hypothetical protein
MDLAVELGCTPASTAGDINRSPAPLIAQAISATAMLIAAAV